MRKETAAGRFRESRHAVENLGHKRGVNIVLARAVVLLASASSLFVACSSSDPEGVGPGPGSSSGGASGSAADGGSLAPDPDAATGPDTGTVGPASPIAKLMASQCDRFLRCEPLVFAEYYTDPADCVARAASYPSPQATAGLTAAQAEACAAKTQAKACGDTSLDVECVLTGSSEVGASCTTNTQCASGYCGGAESTSCGTCQKLGSAAGDTCTGQCLSGFCDLEAGICVALLKEGETGCDGQVPCERFLTCADTNGDYVCEPTPQQGEACSLEGSGCERPLACIDSVCTPPPNARLGEPCGEGLGPRRVACLRSRCGTPEAGAESGICETWPGPGEACEAARGREACDRGLACVGSICRAEQPAPDCN